MALACGDYFHLLYNPDSELIEAQSIFIEKGSYPFYYRELKWIQSKCGVWYEDANSTLATSLFDYFTSLSQTKNIAWNINNIGLWHVNFIE